MQRWAKPLTLLASFGGALVLALACGKSSDPVPVTTLFDPTASGGFGGAGGAGVGGAFDPTLGGPCTEDAQCDDSIPCTFDGCDKELLLCRFQPDDSVCQNELFCDGLEVCDNNLGCILGAPVTCSDGNPCTINTCNEATKLCESEERDVDQDGDPDDHCAGGDCDDLDPTVSSLTDEVCGNGQDDDCDGEIDEAADCATPTNDTCLDPLDIDTPGTYAMTSVAATKDYGATCSPEGPSTVDVVAAILLDPGPPMDVQLTLRSAAAFQLGLALMEQCDVPASEIACSGTFPHPSGGSVAKLRGRALGDAVDPVAMPAYLYSEVGVPLTLKYELLTPTPKPSNETCGTAVALVPSTPTLASVIDPDLDLATACAANTGELVYTFDLAETADIDLYATSIDGDGIPVMSLRDSNCALPEDEITCNESADGHIYRHSLPAGTYYLAVAATAPTDLLLTLEVSDATPGPDDEACEGAPDIPLNETIPVVFDNHQDDHDLGCVPGGVDAAYTLDLSEPSDVLVIGRRANADTGAAVEIALEPCADANDLLVCAKAALSPVRAQKRNLSAGSYRILAESPLSADMELTALVRPAVPPTIVPFADKCSDAFNIAPLGGFFQGTTVNAQADFSAGCDSNIQAGGGAKEQLLRLELAATKRVVFDMQGSGYATLLDVREGPSCPGNEIVKGCAAGFYAERSFLDLQLGAGTYYIQVDGFNGADGPWFLDVFVVDP